MTIWVPYIGVKYADATRVNMLKQATTSLERPRMLYEPSILSAVFAYVYSERFYNL
jgi:hypothetical protein